jgi:hypothetical protein
LRISTYILEVAGNTLSMLLWQKPGIIASRFGCRPSEEVLRTRPPLGHHPSYFTAKGGGIVAVPGTGVIAALWKMNRFQLFDYGPAGDRYIITSKQ